ncbi:hypothetical protein DKX38_007687 [Salix brachista]|uniref:Uncharacterized protein n=1 Tax=Salix brachista TaxID=2182728 RepID=A0A5N5MPB8_9ROSI|nr:hypothetical protein DKX38_007687 [Salix brachista]
MEEKEKESSVIQLTDFKIEVLIHPLPQAAKDLQFADIRLEAHDVPSNQAEAITAVMTGVLNDSLENVAHSFVSKAEIQKSEMIQHANLSKFKSEAQSSQEHHFFCDNISHSVITSFLQLGSDWRESRLLDSSW